MKKNIKKEEGSVIITALAVILILSVTSLVMLKRGFFDLKRSRNFYTAKKVQLSAYSAMELARADIGNRVRVDFQNLTNLLNGSYDDLSSASSENSEIFYKSFELNDYLIKLYIANNPKEIKENLYSEDRDGIIEVRGDVIENERKLFCIKTVLKMDESKKIKAVSTFRLYQ